MPACITAPLLFLGASTKIHSGTTFAVAPAQTNQEFHWREMCIPVPEKTVTKSVF